MWVEITNTIARVIRYEESERAWLQEYLSFDDSSARFRTKGATNKVSLFNALKQEFPAGLVPLVKRGAEKRGLEIDLIDKRKPPCKVDEDADLDWLYWYQDEAVEVGIEKGRGIIKAPTGSGKTEILFGLVKSLPCKWLFLVHSKDLVLQTAERWTERTGEEAFVYRKGVGLPPSSCRFVCCTFQTLYSGIKKKDKTAKAILLNAQGLAVDECHRQPAGSFYRVSMAARNAYYRLGFSGTPFGRGDNKALMAIAALGEPIYKISPETLIDEGKLAAPKIIMRKCYQEVSSATHQGVYGKGIVRSAKRNKLVAGMADEATKPCMLFVKQTNHGKLLLKRLEKAGYSVDFVWGTHSPAQRQRAIKRLEFGDTDVLIASVVFQDGIDIPSLASIVVGSGGKSIIATLQRIGRGMRTDGGRKQEFEVYDVFDVGNAMLERHAKARQRTYVKEGYETSIE